MKMPPVFKSTEASSLSAMTSRSVLGELPARHAPDHRALVREEHIQVDDVLSVIDSRGGAAYPGSVEVGLANRFPHVDETARHRAVARALAKRAIIMTSRGVLEPRRTLQTETAGRHAALA